jgi:hemerythrin superfamily protein
VGSGIGVGGVGVESGWLSMLDVEAINAPTMLQEPPLRQLSAQLRTEYSLHVQQQRAPRAPGRQVMATTVEKTATVASARPTHVQELRGIFARLSAEHGEAALLVERLRTSTDPDLRRAFFPELRDKLLAHEEAELMELYPLLRQHEQTRTLTAEHDRDAGHLHVLIDAVGALEPDDLNWRETFGRLAQALERHVAQEENEIFPTASVAIGTDKAEALEATYVTARQRILERLQEPS